MSVLEKAGFQVFSLPSPIGATRVIQFHDVSAIVLDVVMPALSGDRLTTLLRHNPRFAKLAVVLVSGDGGIELSKLAAKVGADGVVSKKDIRQSLAKRVNEAVRLRAQPAEAVPEALPKKAK